MCAGYICAIHSQCASSCLNHVAAIHLKAWHIEFAQGQVALKDPNSFWHLSWNTSSLVFAKLIFSLFSSAHLSTISNSSLISISHFSGTSKLESSAYLQIWLVAPSGCRSIMQMVNNVRPIPEPWKIDRLIARVNDHSSPILTNWLLSVKHDASQRIILSAILKAFNLFIMMRWSTESRYVIASDCLFLI